MGETECSGLENLILLRMNDFFIVVQKYHTFCAVSSQPFILLASIDGSLGKVCHACFCDFLTPSLCVL